jgi:hypothetical protein
MAFATGRGLGRGLGRGSGRGLCSATRLLPYGRLHKWVHPAPRGVGLQNYDVNRMLSLVETARLRAVIFGVEGRGMAE